MKTSKCFVELKSLKSDVSTGAKDKTQIAKIYYCL